MSDKPPRTRTKKLSIRQLKFCERIACGDKNGPAYLAAGYEVSTTVAASNGFALLKNPLVAAKIYELKTAETAANVLTRDRKRELLREFAENEKASLEVRIRAMAEDSKMAGDYEPDKIEVDAGDKTLASIKARAAKVASALSAASVITKQYE
jgi:phage terminase small subunit